MSIRARVIALFAASISSALALSACGDSTASGGGGAGGTAPAGGAPHEGGGGGTGGGGGAPVDPTLACAELDLPSRPLADGPFGAHRGDYAEPFELPLHDGTTFDFAAAFSGCDSYVFIPSNLVKSALDETSIWEKDLDDLIAGSPRNVHYLFVATGESDAAVTEILDGMQGRIDAVLADLSAEDAAWWKGRLHLVETPIAAIEGWVGDVLGGIGRAGFAIDRDQRVRGIGFLSDVQRYKAALANAGEWPFESNLAYAAHEPIYFNAQELERSRLAEEDATVVKLFDGEVLEQFAETDAALPDAATMAGFDTLEIEVEQACPDPDLIEFGNCGAWDYIATFLVRDDQTTEFSEVARAITSYHRETHWVIDASPMLALLKQGGTRHFKWDFAPEWNTQPTATKLSLRFSNQGKSARPSETTFLWSGGVFDATYNTMHAPVDVAIPADAVKVELVSIVTGHGSEAHQCSEFCNHQHEITVQGTALLHEFPDAGTEEGCIPQIEHGMVPNQGGTWWYGRGGWCPGQQVDAWVEDVTDLVTPGETATFSYRGLYAGADPTAASGNIDLSSRVVIYR